MHARRYTLTSRSALWRSGSCGITFQPATSAGPADVKLKIGGWLRWRFDPEPDVCPTDAITQPQLRWPRLVRRAFSDPVVPHESTGVHGRGTEEVKTNDVTQLVGAGDAGFTVEFGRPTIGVRFRQIQEMTRALAKLGLSFEKPNPVTSRMTDVSTGDIQEDILTGSRRG